MTQTNPTLRYHQYSLPGALVSDPSNAETESIFSPFVAQRLTLTVGGAPDPLVADELFTIQFPLPYGGTATVTYQATNGQTLAQVAAGIALVWNTAFPQAAALYSAASALAVVTIVAKSAGTSIPALQFTASGDNGHTIVVAQSVAASSTTLRLGLLYVYATTNISQEVGPAISKTPRRAWQAAPPTIASTLANLRGVVGREVNSFTLPADFSVGGFDVYPAGHIAPGYLVGEVVAVVDPNSPGVMDIGSDVFWVIAAGAYTTPGAVASAANGGNTIQLNNVSPVRARVTRREETIRMGSGNQSQSVRLVTLKMNQRN